MRRFFLVRDRLERRYLRLIALSLIIPTLVTGGCLYYVIFSIMAEQLAIPEIVACNLLPAVRKVNMILAATLPVVFAILFLVGLILSRNLVGPIKRLEKELKEILSGDFAGRLKLRKNDELRPLVNDINRLIDLLKGGR